MSANLRAERDQLAVRVAELEAQLAEVTADLACICGCPDEIHETVGGPDEGMCCEAHPDEQCLWAPVWIGKDLRELRAQLAAALATIEAAIKPEASP